MRRSERPDGAENPIEATPTLKTYPRDSAGDLSMIGSFPFEGAQSDGIPRGLGIGNGMLPHGAGLAV